MPWVYQVYTLSNPRPIKSLSSSIRYNYQSICRWSRRPEIRQKDLSSWGDQQGYNSFSTGAQITWTRLTLYDGSF